MWIEIEDKCLGIFNSRTSETDPSGVKWNIGENFPEIPDGRRLRFTPTTDEEQTLLLAEICESAKRSRLDRSKRDLPSPVQVVHKALRSEVWVNVKPGTRVVHMVFGTIMEVKSRDASSELIECTWNVMGMSRQGKFDPIDLAIAPDMEAENGETTMNDDTRKYIDGMEKMRTELLAREFWERSARDYIAEVCKRSPSATDGDREPSWEQLAGLHADRMLSEWRKRFDPAKVDTESTIRRREQEAHADGVAQERDRCARIADGAPKWESAVGISAGPVAAFYKAARLIAEKIRSGE
jgi:hypothetical protein